MFVVARWPTTRGSCFNLSISDLPIRLNPGCVGGEWGGGGGEGERHMGIPEYQVLRGLVEQSDRKGGVVR